MGKVLSQEEVDSLLGGMGEGTVETETDDSDSGEEFKQYDFSAQTGSKQVRLPSLGIINERFINSVSGSFSNATGAIVDINVTDVDSVKYGEFCRSLPLPTSLNVFKMDPLRGFALLVFEGPLVFGFVDVFFGGNCSRHVKVEGRSFTTIETKIIERIAAIVLEDYENAWADVYSVNMKYVRSEVDPQFAGISKPDDLVVATKFSVNIGNFSASMTICIPFIMLEPIKKMLSAGFKSEMLEIDHTWRRHFEERIREQLIQVSCNLGAGTISGGELLSMKVDDVITLDQKVNDPIDISVSGISKFEGYPGSINNKKSVQIEKRIHVE
jgi:flagellar motor switch protein FliM